MTRVINNLEFYDHPTYIPVIDSKYEAELKPFSDE
jgi:hypothetical protein